MEQNMNIFFEKMKKRMNSPDAAKRMKCVREIVKHMELDDDYIVEGTEYLVKSLKDNNPGVRMETLNAIETIVSTVMKKIEKDEQFMVKYSGKMVPMKKLLFYQAIQRTRDPDPGIRYNAVTIAGKKSLEYPLIREKATPFLIARIRDEDKDVRNQAISFIIKISYRSPEITSPLLKRLFSGGKRSADIFVAYILDKVMTRHPLPEFIPILFDKFSNADSATENYLISALVKCGVRNPDDIKKFLIEGLTDKSYALWWISARTMLIILRQVAEKKPGSTRPYLRYVLPLLTDENWELRKEAAHTVGVMGTGDPNRVKEAIPTLVDLLRDPDDVVKRTALDALDIIGIRRTDHIKIRDAARTLMKARAKIGEIKKQGDLSKKIRDEYVRARKAFRNGEYDRSLRFAKEALLALKTRTELRAHAHEAIQYSEEVIERAKREGLNVPEIIRLVEDAKKAYDDRKYFLARELIARGREMAENVKPISSYGYSNDIENLIRSVDDSMICHRCGERISKENTRCPGCGVRLDSTVCPHCSSPVPQGFIFCGNCGMEMKHVCQICGAINSHDAKICVVCGGPLEGMYEADELEGELELDVELVPMDLDLRT